MTWGVPSYVAGFFADALQRGLCKATASYPRRRPLVALNGVLRRSDTVQLRHWRPGVRSAAALRESFEGDEGEGVLDTGEPLNLLGHEMADVLPFGQIAF